MHLLVFEKHRKQEARAFRPIEIWSRLVLSERAHTEKPEPYFCTTKFYLEFRFDQAVGVAVAFVDYVDFFCFRVEEYVEVVAQ